MTLVDTSVWVDFFRGWPHAAGLSRLLGDGEVLVHPWVKGELSLGRLGSKGRQILDDLDRLPQAPVLRDAEVLRLVEVRRLSGSGIGWVDAQLLGSALIATARLWTFDRRLRRVAGDLGILRDADSDSL